LFHYYGDYSTIYFFSREIERGGQRKRGWGQREGGKGDSKRERQRE
jgi:hypothetical protein